MDWEFSVASIKTRERQISNLEGFDTCFTYESGRDIRSDMTDIPKFSYDRAAKGDMTVAEWIQKRFKQTYPGFNCQVLDADGTVVHGGMKLSNVRETYQGE